jgi:hypothetical protein
VVYGLDTQILGRKWQKKNNRENKGNKISALRFNSARAWLRPSAEWRCTGEPKAQFGLAKF